MAIDGAGIAGPTLAYWLERSGHAVLLIEAAPALRRGGYVVDFWGIGYDIAERMGLLPRMGCIPVSGGSRSAGPPPFVGDIDYVSRAAGERCFPLPLASASRTCLRRIPEPFWSARSRNHGDTVHNSRGTVLVRSVEDLADAKELRAVISAALAVAPIDERALRCAVWSFVGTERRAGVPPALVITRLAGLVDSSSGLGESMRLALTRSVILWCVEEYFGHLGGDVLATDSRAGPIAEPLVAARKP